MGKKRKCEINGYLYYKIHFINVILKQFTLDLYTPKLFIRFIYYEYSKNIEYTLNCTAF